MNHTIDSTSGANIRAGGASATHANGNQQQCETGNRDAASANMSTEGSLKQKTSEMTDSVKRQASEVQQIAKEKAMQAGRAAKESGQRYIAEKKTLLADEIGVLTAAIRKASGKLHDEQHGSLASYIDVAADRLESMQESLRSQEISDLISQAQALTRRRPELVYGGLFVAGLVAMRFLKSSRPAVDRRNDLADQRDLSDHRNRSSAAFGHAPSVAPTPRTGSVPPSLVSTSSTITGVNRP